MLVEMKHIHEVFVQAVFRMVNLRQSTLTGTASHDT